eukprot:gene4854-biopygen15166
MLKPTVSSVCSRPSNLNMNGLRLHGLSAALRTIKPAPGAEWTIRCGLSSPSQHQGGNSGDSHQAGVSSAHSGQRLGEPTAVPQSSLAPTQRQPTTPGTSGGGEETGGKASTSKDAAPSAPQRGESSDVGGVSEQERARAREDERNVRDFLRTLEESRLHEIVLDKALAYVTSLMPMLVAGVLDVTIPVAAEAEVRVVDELELSFAPTARVPLTSSTSIGPSIRICVLLGPPRPTQGKIVALNAWSAAPDTVFDVLAVRSPDRVVHIDSGAGRCITGSQALFSTFQFVSNGLSVNATARDLACVISFTSDTCHATIGPRTLWQIPVSPLGVYQFDAVVGEIPSLLCVDLDVSKPPMSPIELWHKRFGHPGFPAMSQLIQGTLVSGMLIISNQQLRKFKERPCDACARGKAKRVPYHEPRRKTHSPLEIVHVDLMGPFSQGLRGENYLLVMVDDYSNWQAVVAMVTKGDSAFWIVNTLKAWIVNTLKAWMALLVGLLDKDSRKGKLDGRALRGEMIGYAPVSKAWQLWLPDSHRIIESRDDDWYEGAGPAPVPGQDPFDGDFSLDGPETAVNGLGPEVVTSPTPSDSPVGTAAGSDSGFCISDSESGPGFHMQLRSRNQAPAVFPTVAGQALEMTGLVTPSKSNVPDLPVLPVSPVGELVRYPPSPVPAVLSSSPTSDLVDNPLFLDATSASGSVSGGDTPEPMSEAPGLTLPAYISTSSDISYKQAMDQSNLHRDGWLLAMRDEMESLHAHGTW